MDKKIFNKILQLVGQSLRLVLILSLCGCAAKREIIPYQQSQNKQNVSVGLSVDDNANSSFTVSTANPVVLRTFIMQGFSLDFRGQYAYLVKVPCAKDVEKAISHHPGEVKATMQGANEKRPDIRPVLEALNKVDVFIYAKGKKVGKVKKFNVSIEPATGQLLYSITLPNIYGMNLPVTITLTSKREIEGDEIMPGQFQNRNESDRPQPFGVGQPSRPNDSQKELIISYTFGKPATAQPRQSLPSEIHF